MNYKLLLIFCTIFLLTSISAYDFDNKLSYSNNDLKVDFKNAFGLGKDLLSGEEILEISSTGGLDLSLFDMASKLIKGISKPDLLLDLNYLRIRMKEISSIPSMPESFLISNGSMIESFRDAAPFAWRIISTL